MNSVKDEQIKEAVRQAYGRVAQQVGERSASAGCGCSGQSMAACCSPSEMKETSASRLYPAQDLADLPESVTGIAMGCGNPVALADLHPGEVVLDLGAGGGLDCFLAAKKVGPQGRVIGLDMTPELIKLARRNAKKMGATNVEFQYGEIEEIPLPDNSMDMVMSNCVINLSPDKDAVFREAYRVLRPGGRMIVSDIVTEGEIAQRIRQSLEAWAGCVAGALDVKDYLDKIRAAGFTQVEVLSRDVVLISQSAGWDESRAFLEEMGLAPDALDHSIISLKVRAYKPESGPTRR